MVEESHRIGYPESDHSGFDDVPPGFNVPKTMEEEREDMPPGFFSQRKERGNMRDDDSCGSSPSERYVDDNRMHSLAPANEDLEPYSDFEADEDNYQQGQWWYVVTEAKGAVIKMQPDDVKKECKNAARLPFGEMVWVCERGFLDGVSVLHLGDGRGWVREVVNGKRFMSECFREELDPPEMFTSVGKTAAVIYSTPCWSAPDKMSITVPPGEVILSRERASVLCKGKKGEEQMTFYKIDSKGGGIYSRKSGWVVEHANGESIVAPIRIQDMDTPEWYLVVHERGIGLRSGPTTSEKSRVGSKDTGLPHGEFVCVDQKAFQNDTVYLKLKNGGWAFESKGEARAMVKVVSELHSWTYACVDKQGAQIRKAPCRVDSQKTGRKVKYRQRMVVTEKARVGDEVFLRCAPPIDGWVSEMKRNGDRKMRPMHPAPPVNERGKAPQSEIGRLGSQAPGSQYPGSQHPSSQYPGQHPGSSQPQHPGSHYSSGSQYPGSHVEARPRSPSNRDMYNPLSQAPVSTSSHSLQSIAHQGSRSLQPQSVPNYGYRLQSHSAASPPPPPPPPAQGGAPIPMSSSYDQRCHPSSASNPPSYVTERPAGPMSGGYAQHRMPATPQQQQQQQQQHFAPYSAYIMGGRSPRLDASPLPRAVAPGYHQGGLQHPISQPGHPQAIPYPHHPSSSSSYHLSGGPPPLSPHHPLSSSSYSCVRSPMARGSREGGQPPQFPHSGNITQGYHGGSYHPNHHAPQFHHHSYPPPQHGHASQPQYSIQQPPLVSHSNASVRYLH